MARPSFDRCPKCQGPLYSGYLSFMSYLKWCETKPSRWHSFSGSLVAGSNWFLALRSTKALQCPKCQLILVQPDKEEGRS